MNITGASLQSIGKYFVNRKREKEMYEYFKRSFKIKSMDVSDEIGSLSGGNQQKVVIAKAIASMPKLLILDEPTRGIDAGARGDVYKIIQELKERGLAILMISSDMEKIVQLSDRAVTIFIDGNGKVLTRNAGLPGLLGRRGVHEVARAAVRFEINPVGEPACVMFRRRDYEAIGGFDGSNVFAMDIDAWLRILTRGDMFGQSESHAAFRMWTESFSNSHNRQQLDDHIRFLRRVANDPRYEIPAVLRRLAPAAAHISWRAWTMQQRLWGRKSASKTG